MRSSSALLLVAAVSVVSFADPARGVAIGPVTELSGPAGFTLPYTVIGFDGDPEGTAANTLYSGSGVTFSNCDPLPCTSAPILIEDWTGLSRVTTSPTNALVTDSDPDAGAEFSDFLDLFFAAGTLEVGAYFGNDQGLQPALQMELSVFDASDGLIGSVLVDVNANTSIDQFAGLRSDSTPFYRARFTHVAALGDLSIALDDVRFTAVPEPGTGLLIGCGLAILAGARRRK